MTSSVPEGLLGVGTFGLYERELLPGDDKTINTRVGETMSAELTGETTQADNGGNPVADQPLSSTSGAQITAGTVAKSILAWADSQGVKLTQRRVKQFVDRMWPGISGAELLSRSRKLFYLVAQLEANGWLESEEAQQYKRFDRKMTSHANSGVPIPLEDMTIRKATGAN